MDIANDVDCILNNHCIINSINSLPIILLVNREKSIMIGSGKRRQIEVYTNNLNYNLLYSQQQVKRP